MKNSRFKITDFLNPSGSRVFRVSGTLDGKTIRKNFKSRAEAVAHRQELEIEFLNGESTGQTVWTTLTHDQNRDAIAAVNMLKRGGSSKSLTFAVDFFLRHFDEGAEDVAVENAVEAYLLTKQVERERGILSIPQERSLRTTLRRFARVFEGRMVSDVQPDELRAFLEEPAREGVAVVSLKTWNNRRGYLSTFYKYCLVRKHVSQNPILAIPQFKISKKRGTAETLSAERAAAFMAWLETYPGLQGKSGRFWGQPGCLVNCFALALFAGVRPDWRNGEMGKLRPEHIRLDTGVILIEPDVSKVNEKRAIKIQPNLRMWLERYPLSQYPVIPFGRNRFDDVYAAVRKQWNLPYDVLRHTYISMTVGAFRSVGDAALQAGNSEAVIRRHYLDLKSVEEADAFWRIVPEGMSLPKRMKKVEGRYVERAGKRQKAEG